MTDESNGYESIAETYIKVRGRAINGIGSATVRVWARTLKKGSVVLDIGCGTGIPVTKILLDQGLAAYALDASPTMIEDFRRNFPLYPLLVNRWRVLLSLTAVSMALSPLDCSFCSPKKPSGY